MTARLPAYQAADQLRLEAGLQITGPHLAVTALLQLSTATAMLTGAPLTATLTFRATPLSAIPADSASPWYPPAALPYAHITGFPPPAGESTLQYHLP